MALTRRELDLIAELAWTDFKMRYNSSKLGFVWSFLNPLMMLTTLYVVFHLLMRSNIEQYPLFLLLGIILWNYFAESTVAGIAAVSNKAPLINRIRFRKDIIVFASGLTTLLSFTLNMIVFAVFMLVFGAGLSWHVLYLPVVVFQFLMLTLGISFGLGAVYTRYHDTKHIWEVLLQIGFFLTPIFYQVGIIPPEYAGAYMLNPVTRIITSARELILYHQMADAGSQVVTFVICASALAGGYAYFRSRRDYLADEV